MTIVCYGVMSYYIIGCLHSRYRSWFYLCLAREGRHSAGEEGCLQERCGKHDIIVM